MPLCLMLCCAVAGYADLRHTSPTDLPPTAHQTGNRTPQRVTEVGLSRTVPRYCNV